MLVCKIHPNIYVITCVYSHIHTHIYCSNSHVYLYIDVSILLRLFIINSILLSTCKFIYYVNVYINIFISTCIHNLRIYAYVYKHYYSCLTYVRGSLMQRFMIFMYTYTHIYINTYIDIHKHIHIYIYTCIIVYAHSQFYT